MMHGETFWCHQMLPDSVLQRSIRCVTEATITSRRRDCTICRRDTYDPKVRRFLNADDASVLTKDPEQLTEKNLYAYCDDNPVMYRDDAGMFAFSVGLGVLGMVTNVATCYIAAKATGQEFGIGDLVIAAVAGAVGGAIRSNFCATLASAFASGIGTVIYSKLCKESWETAIWKGGMTALCTAVSVNLFVGKIVKPTVVEKIITTTFSVGNGLVTAGAVAALPYRKASNKKNYTQNKRKSNPVVKNYKKITKQQERARKYFMFKMNQLRER